MDWVTTTTLLQDLHDDRDDRAWGMFVLRFRTPVVDFARRLGVPSEDAQDLAQEVLATFVHLYREGRYDRHRGRLSSWLFGIAYRYVLRSRRSNLAAREEPYAEPAPEGRESAIEVWNRGWDRIFLEECVERARAECSPEAFRAFALVVLEGLSPADAAGSLGVPVKRVYNDKHRVLTRIRELRGELEGWTGPRG